VSAASTPPIAYATARCSGSTALAAPGTAIAAAISSAPSSFRERSDQYQPSAAASRTAVLASPAAIAPRIAACMLS
jgi:hypothetical protein